METNETTGEVTKKEVDRLGVYYSDLVPVLIKAIQEQNEAATKLKEELKDITAKYTELKNTDEKYNELLARIEMLEEARSN